MYLLFFIFNSIYTINNLFLNSYKQKDRSFVIIKAAKPIKQKGIYPMEIIAKINQLKKDIEKISLNMYIIQSNLNVLELVNPIPSNVYSLLSNPEITELVSKLNVQLESFNALLTPINRKLKSALYKQKHSTNKDEPYAGFKVDEKPITGQQLIKELQDKKSDFNDISNQYLLENGKTLKPINRKSQLPYKGDCLFCGAPNSYLYNNNNGDQCLCKACHNTFSYKTKFYDETGFYCPHCKSKLELRHDRNNYLVYSCRNDKCSYYLDSLSKQVNNDKSLKTVSNCDKLHYTYRAFKFTTNDVNNSFIHFNTTINLENAHHSPQTIGTILTLYVNYGLSSRKVSMLMKDLFNIKISHQTVMNYGEAAASKLQNLIVNYKYNISNIQAGDETYIKVLGKTRYVFFFSDPINKIITSWKIYEHRDTKNAVESILMAINKYEHIPDDLLIITDANPIYSASQIFLSMYGINFNLQQVVGVSNKDEISKKYRPYKQVEERLNRTYKQNYSGTNGYQTLTSANVYMVLYVTFFNFLRRHSSLNYNTPVQLEVLNNDTMLMPDKWIHLINLSQSYLN